jgi:hypothetical protein
MTDVDICVAKDSIMNMCQPHVENFLIDIQSWMVLDMCLPQGKDSILDNKNRKR